MKSVVRGIVFVWIIGFVAPAMAVHATVVFCPADATVRMKLAAKEVRRYVYLRTGELAAIKTSSSDRSGASDKIITLAVDPALSAQEYRLKTTGNLLAISGGSDIAVLYGAYAFAEKLGIRFYLRGDVIPDGKIPFTLPQLNETHKPIFETRGIQPFHDFTEGPDWWQQDDYLAYVSQLAKLRMNFIGLHCYPEHNNRKRPFDFPASVNQQASVANGTCFAEPLVWIGLPQDCDANGHVTFSYPAWWSSTERCNAWGYANMKTIDYAGGASLLFPTDSYGPDVMDGMLPVPSNPQQNNDLFNRIGQQMGTVFTLAKSLGVKTCIGTETPLTLPTIVREHLKQLGKDPGDCNVVREVYKGIFKRITATCPVDYYWLWMPEAWTWSGNSPAQYEATKRDLQAALDALKELGNPFTLATSGWTLGPVQDRSALDKFLPKDSPMSCINRLVGHSGVEPGFANITGRPKWAIPWLENDPNMVGLQPWVARMRYDAVDARRFGCTGLMGLHWRVKVMEMNIAALAAAGWDQSWVPPHFDATPVKTAKGVKVAGKNRGMPAEDFYIDFARANFGDSVAEPAGKLFARIDGLNCPVVSDWVHGPGVFKANSAPWESAKQQFAFVDEFAALRQHVKGAGALHRFDCQLNTYRSLAAMAEACCTRGRLDRAMKQKNIPEALAARIELGQVWTRLMTLQTAIVTTPGDLGTIANLEQHNRKYIGFVEAHDAALTKALGKPLPATTALSNEYEGPAQIILPTVRSCIAKDETLTVKIIALDREPVKSVSVNVRPLGMGRWQTISATHVGRAVYKAALPATADDFEYHIVAITAKGTSMIWPDSAPELNQTVVVQP